MKKLIPSLAALALIGFSPFPAQAQPAPKIYVVDISKVFTEHYETKAETAKLQSDEQKAQVDLDQMQKDRDALISQYKDLRDQANNPMATNDAKSKATISAQQKAQEIQAKTDDMQRFVQETQRTLQERRQKFQVQIVNEIIQIATSIAKDKGGNLVLDRSGLPVVYADPAYDITDEVMAQINKNRPAPEAAPAAAPASSATPAASAK